MTKGAVPHTRKLVASEVGETGHKRGGRHVADERASQTPLVQYFAALGQHPQLQTDLTTAHAFVHCSPAGVLQGAGKGKSIFLAEIAVYWLLCRYVATWDEMPSMGAHVLMRLIRHALEKSLTWENIVGAVAEFERHSLSRPMRVTVEATLHEMSSDQGRGSTRLYKDDNKIINRAHWLSMGDTYVEVRHRLEMGSTLEEYLESARRAWEQAHIREHIFSPRINQTAGKRKDYGQHVDIYRKWYEYHCVQQRPTYTFVDAVTSREIQIEGWATPPTCSAIEQRLSSARRWLTPRAVSGSDSLEALLHYATLTDEDSFQFATPDGTLLLVTYVESPGEGRADLPEAS